MPHRLARSAAAALVGYAVFIGWGEAQSPPPKVDGPVQGYQGGYDPIDKSKAPAAPEGQKADTGNADEGRRGTSVSRAIAAIDGRRLTLESGLVLVMRSRHSLHQKRDLRH